MLVIMSVLKTDWAWNFMCLSSCILLYWCNYTCKKKCSILVFWDV